MRSHQGITLAICTRNRHEDLERCIRSIAKQAPVFPIEVLIIDDGDIPEHLLTRFTANLNVSQMEMIYHHKQSPGLLLSRIEAVRLAKYEILLFIDDDVELESGYLNRLRKLYYRFPNASGIGGRDVGLDTSFIWRLFCRVFFYGSGNPGKLSISGYGGSMPKWGLMKAPFKTEYLVGCNMSFRVSGLLDLQPAEWLMGYSVGEDIYLTQKARRSGEVWLDPRLQVIHHQSPLSRDKAEQVAYMEIVNHYYLLRENKGAMWRFAFLLWTSFGLLFRSFLRISHRPKRHGYWRGIRFLFTHNRRRLADESVVNHGNE